jgi:ABC-type uncharacterized transport system substrate-binding protein
MPQCASSQSPEGVPAGGRGDFPFAGEASGRTSLHPSKIVLLAFALALFAGRADAHPHVWIKATATVEFHDGKIVGVLHEWAFDEFFSSTLISDFDKNQNKKFDPDEIRELHDHAFIALKDYGYFTHIRIDHKEVRITATKDFFAMIRDGKVVYRFFAELPKPVDPRKQHFDTATYDDTYYVDVAINPEHGTRLSGPGSKGCEARFYTDKSSPIYFGLIFVHRAEINCK